MKLESQMTCEEVRADLPLFVGGDLFDDQQAPADALRRHLTGCPSCAEELVSLKRAREAFLSLGEGSSAPGLWPDVRAVLAAEGRFGDAAVSTQMDRFRPLVAATLLLGVGVFAWLGSDKDGESSGSGESSGLAFDEAPTPSSSSLVSPLRPLLPGELALSLEAEAFGVDETIEIVIPSPTPGASAAGLTKIR